MKVEPNRFQTESTIVKKETSVAKQRNQNQEWQSLNNSGGMLVLDLDFEAKRSHNSVDNGNASGMIFALFQNKFNKEVMNSKDSSKNQMTALHKVAVQGSLKMAEWLIEKGAEIDAKDENESTPLHLASIKGWKKIGQTLLKNGANINAKDTEGETPLHYAAIKDNHKVVEFLIENKAELNAKSNLGETPIHLAADTSSSNKTWNLEVFDYLLNQNQDLK